MKVRVTAVALGALRLKKPSPAESLSTLDIADSMPKLTQSKRTYILWGSILCGFYVLLALLVHNRILISIDLQTTLLLQQIIPRAADLPFSILSLLGSVEITAAIFFILVLLARPSIRVPLVLMFALVAVLELQGKTMLAQPGPPDELSRYVFWFGTPTGRIATPYSFPSGHSARACFLGALSITLVAQSKASPRMKRWLTALLLIAGATMLVSRVYLGDHWVADVVGGALLGAGLFLLACLTDWQRGSRINNVMLSAAKHLADLPGDSSAQENAPQNDTGLATNESVCK